MISYLGRRLITSIIVIIGVSIFIFFLLHAIYPSPARQVLGLSARPAQVAAWNKSNGYDDPVIVQYFRYMNQLLHGNLGYSYAENQSVLALFQERVWRSVYLSGISLVIAVIIALPLGIYQAVKRNTLGDNVATSGAFILYSMPSFFLGLMLLFFLYYKLTLAGYKWFPAGGYAPLSQGVGQWFLHMVLPWLTLALVLAATYTRLTRSSMLDVLGEDYIKTARSKGLNERRVTYRHALRSALTPVVTQFGIDLGQLIGGVVITETVFSLPGLGKTAIDAITQQDLPVIIGIVLFASACVVVANILVDLLYAFLDPRVRLS